MTEATTAQAGTGDGGAAAAAGAEKIETGAAAAGGAAKDTAAAATLAGGTGDGTKDGAAAGAAKDGAAATTGASDGWRDRMAGGDPDFRKRLERFATEGDLAKSYRALEQKLSSGEFKKALAPDAKPEEVAAYRKEIGVPEKAEEYKIELPNGMVLPESDQANVAFFKQFAHKENMPPETFNKLLAFNYELQDALASKRLDDDGSFKTKTEDELRVEWGADFRANLNAANAIFDSMPAELSERIRLGRTADGTIIANDPMYLRWIANLGRELNPAATVIPGGSGDAGKTVETELADIRKFARENPDKYDADKPLQARQRELLDVQSKMKARGKAA